MFTRKDILYMPFLFLMVLTAGCATTYAPPDWLPKTNDIPQSTNGGWITVNTEVMNDKNEIFWMQYSGEFIAVDETNLYILYDSLYIIPKIEVVYSVIELDQKKTGSYTVWFLLGSCATISNGYYLLITYPLWLIGGIPTITGESYRDRYEIELPDEIYWEDINKFSRFPQGVENVNLSDLEPVFISSIKP
jgi:hypothetical protein